jgi:hypothetical protein
MATFAWNLKQVFRISDCISKTEAARITFVRNNIKEDKLKEKNM